MEKLDTYLHTPLTLTGHIMHRRQLTASAYRKVDKFARPSRLPLLIKAPNPEHSNRK
jgi:hypothetical protein